MRPKIKVKIGEHQKGQNVTSTPTTKACVKEHKGNKKDNFSLFLGSIGWKKNGIVTNLKLSEWDELSKLSNNGVVLFWKKELINLALSVIYIHQYYKDKYNFASATNNVMYVQIVSGLYQGCPAI